MKNQKIVQVRDLIAGYDGDIILDRISFDIHEGEIFIILGGSGCGLPEVERNQLLAGVEQQGGHSRPDKVELPAAPYIRQEMEDQREHHPGHHQRQAEVSQKEPGTTKME